MDATKVFPTSVVVLIATGVLMSSVHADTFSFDTDTAGSLPPEWEQGVTGRGPVGMCTRAVGVTVFDDFRCASATAPQA